MPADESVELAERLVGGDRRALGRAMSEVEDGSPLGSRVLATLAGRAPQVGVVGVTGPPGAGKSTLVGALATRFLEQGSRLGVLLVDPSSPRSGGAVLADRLRMSHHARDERLFVRSVAARGHHGGLTRATGLLVGLLGAWGADLVIVETVGAGQNEVAVSALADCTVVVCPPGLGDEVQAMKAGVLEVADVFVVNKADRPGAVETAANLLAVAGHDPVTGALRPILQTVATTGAGVDELAAELQRRIGKLEVEASTLPGPAELRRVLAARAAAWVQERVTDSDQPEMTAIVEAVCARELDLETAVRRAVARITEDQS